MDAQDNLTGVCQGGSFSGGVCQNGQSRTFAYSSLGRLLSATNLESDTVEYRYDASGNLRLKWDLRENSAVTMTHDGLNRVKSRSYADGTPDVSYGYDTCANGKGRLCSVSNTVSSTSFSYDALGRTAASSQTTAGVTYPFQYEYNLADGLRKVTYPSGRVVTTCYDAAGREWLVHNGDLATPADCDTAAAGNYAVVAGFAAHGAARDMQLGNLLWERTEYNSRLQAADLRLGTSQGASDKWRLQNGYSLTANNGNVMCQTIGPLNVTQSFDYDGVNRLWTASEGATWSRTFDYNAFGNQWVSAWSGVSPGSFTPTSSSWFDARNRLTGAPSADYDEAGNQKQIGGYSFLYDAENRVKESTINSVTTAYAYDGEGRRVKKEAGSNPTVFVYDAFGRLAAEYGPEDLAQAGVRYRTVDHLGSTRVVTDGDGDVQERHDYLPFGEELFAGAGGRTEELRYPASDTGLRHKFTGKERDQETGLDWFGTRYLSSAQGRFTSPDKPFADQHPEDPQSWNLYSYARNNPLKFVDLAGQEVVYADERLRIISETRRAQSPSYDSWLRGFDGPTDPNLRIGYGGTPSDPDGSATIGNFRGNINPAILNCSSATDCQTIPGRLLSGEITVNNSLENDPERSSDVLAHEVRHADDARTNPDRYVNEPIRDQRGRVIPHDQRPVERRANQGRDQSNRERRDFRRNNPERNRELVRQQRERLLAEEERRRREGQH